MTNSTYKNPKVSVIVCCHNQAFIHKFVESVKKSSFTDYEIIVITSDNSLKEIKGCRVFQGDDMPAAKRNQGAVIAKGEYLAFFDDDVEICFTCLTHLMGAGEEQYIKKGMTYGKLMNAEYQHKFDEAGGYLTSTGFIWSRAGQNDGDRGQFDEVREIFSGKSASCMIRKDVFHDIGGFDEDFGILGEESDLSWRVWLYGYKVIFTPAACGIHYFNTKWKPPELYYNSERVNYNGARNYITMLIKNLGRSHLWILIPHISIWVLTGLLMCVTGKPIQGKCILRGVWYNFRNLRYILRKRKEVQSKRVKSDRDIWPYIYRRPPRRYYTQRFTRYLSIGLHG